jgi:KDO2-lipid IV(A) lauroyltransferase
MDPRSRWTRRQRWKNDFLYGLVRASFALLPLAPRWLLRGLGAAAGWLVPRVGGGLLRTAEENLARVFPRLLPDERRRLALRSFARLGGWFADALAMASGRRAAILPFAGDGAGILRAAMAEGRGVVLVSAHLGPWEQVASSLVAHGVPLMTVTRGAYDPRLDFVYRRLRGPAGVGAIERGAPGSTARIVRTLRRGGVLGAPMDLATRARSVESRFLGQPVQTAVGPARLALAAGAAVVVVTAGPVTPGEPERLALHVARVERGERGHAGTSRNEAARQLTRRLDDVLGARILAFPEGWVWMHERFAEHRRTSRLDVNSPPRSPQPAWSSPPASTSRSPLG